ncbi:polysaccharide pyruvyl transferase family protein [Agromyces terreus]
MASLTLGEEAASGKRERLLSVGSVMHFAKPGDHVWGSGINGKVAQPVRVRAGDLHVHAVRGPLSRKYLASRGHDVPEVYGDPALLIAHVDDRFCLAGAVKLRRRLVVPNLNDASRYRHHPDAVSPLADPIDIARLIASSEFVVGSSLHAMVLADVYGVPSRPLVSGHESTFKYEDYYSGTGRELPEFALDIDHADKLGAVQAAMFNPQPLIASFPKELFRSATESSEGAPSSNRAHRRGSGTT